MVIKKRFEIKSIYAKMFIKNTVPRTNYTQLHKLGGLGERWKLRQRGPGQSAESFSFNSIFIDKKDAFCKLYWSELTRSVP